MRRSVAVILFAFAALAGLVTLGHIVGQLPPGTVKVKDFTYSSGRFAVYHSPTPLSDADARKVLTAERVGADKSMFTYLFEGELPAGLGDHLEATETLGQAIDAMKHPPGDGWSKRLWLTKGGDETWQISGFRPWPGE